MEKANSKWGLFVEEELMVTYESYDEALHAVNYAYEETGIPHEIKKV